MGQKTNIAEPLQIEGVIEKITFHNFENGFSVLKVHAKEQRDWITVVGYASSVAVGESIVATGEWTKNKDYGEQFAASSIQVSAPNTLEEVEKYLKSGAIKGIGEHFAAKLVKAFGEGIFKVIDQSPEKLLEIENIGTKRLQLIRTSWKENSFVRHISIFLHQHGVGPSIASKIYNKYGENAVDQVKTNPYQLIRDIPGLGFKSADQIALQLGMNRESHLRARAGINYLLTEKIKNGHCAYPRDQLLKDAESILNIDQAVISAELDQELKDGFLVSDTIEHVECIYQKTMHRMEQSVAQLLLQLKEGSTPWPHPTHLDKSLIKTEKKLKLTLAPLQKLAIQTALVNKICVITGGPGTGKSTLTRALVNYLSQLDLRLCLCSPTGRAAKRLSECTGLEAKTVHSLLMFEREKEKFKYNSLNPLKADLVLVDEASMLDIFLARALLQAIPPHAVLVIVGDVDQLPSVGPGQFLKDVIDSQAIPVVTLSQIFRQAKESQITQVARQINEGIMPDLNPHRQSDFFFLEKNTHEEVAETILDLVSHRLPVAYHFDPMHDIQVLCPMQKGMAGVKNLNSKMQQLLNRDPIAKIEKFGFYYGVGDRVMITENNYDKDVFNGDMGLIESINIEDQIMKINIENRLVEINFSELESVQPSYAITIHKSQGSEYPAVIIPVVNEHAMMMQKNLIYTAITRGKKLVILVGQTRALHLAVNDLKKRKRWTKLKEWLNPDENSGSK